MASASGSEVRGPEATITFPDSGIWVTSPSSTVMRGWERSFSVTARANPWRFARRPRLHPVGKPAQSTRESPCGAAPP